MAGWGASVRQPSLHISLGFDKQMFGGFGSHPKVVVFSDASFLCAVAALHTGRWHCLNFSAGINRLEVARESAGSLSGWGRPSPLERAGVAASLEVPGSGAMTVAGDVVRTEWTNVRQQGRLIVSSVFCPAAVRYLNSFAMCL